MAGAMPDLRLPSKPNSTAPASWLLLISHSTEENKKHLKNVGPIRHNEPPHANSPDVASGTVARRLRIDVQDNDDNDNADRGDRYGPMEWAQK